MDRGYEALNLNVSRLWAVMPAEIWRIIAHKDTSSDISVIPPVIGDCRIQNGRRFHKAGYRLRGVDLHKHESTTVIISVCLIIMAIGADRDSKHISWPPVLKCFVFVVRFAPGVVPSVARLLSEWICISQVGVVGSERRRNLSVPIESVVVTTESDGEKMTSVCKRVDIG